jgi:hypothetical protein
MWPRLFQWSKYPQQWVESDSQLKTEKRADDLLGNEPNESIANSLEDLIHSFLSKRYPEALKYKKEIRKDVTKMLRQMKWINYRCCG